uniref:Uncharacterized protein n=1 Tax=Fundulus heteroclitus TaxID=8078 RepID=A0A3Q2ULC6_FUNHE
MEAKEEFLDIIQRVGTKLQGLPQAGPLELGAFAIILLFIGKPCLSPVRSDSTLGKPG